MKTELRLLHDYGWIEDNGIFARYRALLMIVLLYAFLGIIWWLLDRPMEDSYWTAIRD